MSWLLFAFGLLCAIHLANAFRPVRRNRVLLVWSFFAAWLTIEGVVVWLILEAVVGALLVWGGALEHWSGWVGLALLGVSFVAQTVLYGQGRAAEATADRELDDFGAGALAARPDVSRQKVAIDRNVEYRKVDGKRLRLDVFRPAGAPEPGARRPVIVQIHGGAWIIGDKREQGLPLLRYLAARGWVGFNVNYRLSPGVTFPGHLIDIKAALAWIREHADTYGIDPDFVVVTGGSAGGHLTAMTALTANDPQYQPGFETADTSVQAAVPFYGVYDFTNRGETMSPEFLDWVIQPLVVKAFIDDEPEKFRAASPLDQVHPDAPPFLVVHGDKDTLAPVEDARLFAERLRSTSRSEVFYVELHGAQHAFDVFRSPRSSRMVKATERFLFAVHDAYLHRPESALAPPDDTSAPPASLEGDRTGAPDAVRDASGQVVAR
jgi:acetyl esterase/lipase